MKKRAIVIGSGFAGLSASAHLSKAGYSVTVLEKNEMAGGRARVWKRDGFTFDMGPSWYMMVDIFEDFFKTFGTSTNKFFETKLLDPSYKIFYEDGTVLTVSSNLEENIQLFESIEKGAGEKLKKFLAEAKVKYEISKEEVLYKPFLSFKDFASFKLLKESSRLHVFQNLDSYIRSYFKNEKLVQILEYITLFLGSAPKHLPAVYTLMNYVDFGEHVWYPMGGMGKIISAMEQVAKNNGVEFIYNTEVKHIKIEDGIAKKVMTDSKTYEADIVISTADYPHTETNLLDIQYQTYPKSYWGKKIIAPSAFLLYLGLNTKLKNVEHHNYYFRNSWQEHFKYVFDTPNWEPNPSYYMCVPSVTDKTVAPKGCENVFLLVPSAVGLDDSDKIRKSYRDDMLKHLEELIGQNITKHIVVERIYTMRDYAKDYNAYKGTALGMALNLSQTAVFRPKIKSNKVKNLYYAGQYTHPGCGMAPCIIAGKLVADQIQKDFV